MTSYKIKTTELGYQLKEIDRGHAGDFYSEEIYPNKHLFRTKDRNVELKQEKRGEMKVYSSGNILVDMLQIKDVETVELNLHGIIKSLEVPHTKRINITSRGENTFLDIDRIAGGFNRLDVTNVTFGVIDAPRLNKLVMNGHEIYANEEVSNLFMCKELFEPVKNSEPNEYQLAAVKQKEDTSYFIGYRKTPSPKNKVQKCRYLEENIAIPFDKLEQFMQTHFYASDYAEANREKVQSWLKSIEAYTP